VKKIQARLRQEYDCAARTLYFSAHTEKKLEGTLPVCFPRCSLKYWIFAAGVSLPIQLYFIAFFNLLSGCWQFSICVLSSIRMSVVYCERLNIK